MYLRGPGDVNWNNAEGFGFTTGKIDNGVVTGAGTISGNKSGKQHKDTVSLHLQHQTVGQVLLQLMTMITLVQCQQIVTLTL